MTSERVLRFDAPSRGAFDLLATRALPAGVEAGQAKRSFFRDVFFDTVGSDLDRRGATAWLRVYPDGRRVLTVDLWERGEDGGPSPHTRVEAPVADGEIQEVFAGPTEPARHLRALTDPSRLVGILELETTCWERRIHLTGAPEVEAHLVCEALVVRRGDRVADVRDVEIRLPEDAGQLEQVVRTLENEYRLKVTFASKVARARDALESMELEELEEAVRGAREVAVVVHAEGKIGLAQNGPQLRVPTGPGWGEESCRQVIRAMFGRAHGQIRLVGHSYAIGSRPAVEVWLAERVPTAEEAVEPVLTWLPLDDALRLAGSPALRDAATLTALQMIARRGIPQDAPWSERPLADGEHPFQLSALIAAGPVAVPAAPEPGQPPVPLAPEALINMEQSEIAFNARVLALARDPRTPLLERVRFLSILGSNLDQFFMTRVAGFHQQAASGSVKRTLDGLTPEQQLDLINIRARELYNQAYDFLWGRLIPDLEEEGVRILDWSQLEEGDRSYLTDNYASQLGAVLTPMAADPSHPFPHIRNLRPALGIVVRVPETRSEHFAAIELPGDLPRFVPLPGGRRFIPLEDVIEASLPTLYSGLELIEAHMFRVTRSANFTIDEEGVSDILMAVEEKVHQRPLGPVIRLEVEESMPREMRDLLLRELQFESRQRAASLREEDVYAVDRLVDLYGLREVAGLPIEELHYPPLQRNTPLPADRSVWPLLREKEVLVEFPFDSFESTVERVLADAARDERVHSIKITLYRTSSSSRVVKLLRKARRKGKEVVALVELKASFDEKRNIEWARSLESAGIHVVYGPAHLKVHAKVLLIVRKEKDELRRYLYIGTGNLNAATAAGYTDLGLLSTDQALGAELNDVFNGLTGYSVRTDYEQLLVAPFNMRTRFLQMIEREAEHARSGGTGAIRVKLNGLTDPEVIAALYRASADGVRIQLIVRGLCSLRPGVPGLSENISVISILGRFLEHSRIYRFENAGSPEYFIGSADWRPRNLSRRVEVVAPIHDEDHRATLDEILANCLDNPDAWELGADGHYTQRPGPPATST